MKNQLLQHLRKWVNLFVHKYERPQQKQLSNLGRMGYIIYLDTYIWMLLRIIEPRAKGIKNVKLMESIPFIQEWKLYSCYHSRGTYPNILANFTYFRLDDGKFKNK